jgi:hypothetical protein
LVSRHDNLIEIKKVHRTTAAGSGDAFADGLGRMYAWRGLNQTELISRPSVV